MKFKKFLLFFVVCASQCGYTQNVSVYEQQQQWQMHYIHIAEGLVTEIMEDMQEGDFGMIMKNCERALLALYLAEKPIEGFYENSDPLFID